jgi:hypothetical protein
MPKTNRIGQFDNCLIDGFGSFWNRLRFLDGHSKVESYFIDFMRGAAQEYLNAMGSNIAIVLSPLRQLEELVNVLFLLSALSNG